MNNVSAQGGRLGVEQHLRRESVEISSSFSSSCSAVGSLAVFEDEHEDSTDGAWVFPASEDTALTYMSISFCCSAL